MGVVRCDRCDRYIDLDYNVEVFTKDQIPNLRVTNEWDWVCFDCLDDDEAEALDEMDIL